MADDTAQRTIKQLRDQVARLISRNLELQRQIEDLRRAQAALAVEVAAASLVESIRVANAAFAAEAEGGARFAVSQLEATIRAGLMVEGDRLTLALPRAELPLPKDYLGSVTLKLAQLPVVAEPPGDAGAPALVAALEHAQAAFAGWGRRQGRPAARELAALATRLLAPPLAPGAPEFAPTLRAFAAAAEAFRKATTRSVPAPARATLADAVGRLGAAARTSAQPEGAAGRDRGALADAIAQLAREVEAIGGAA